MRGLPFPWALLAPGLLPDVALAEVGLASPVGGFFVLLVVAAAAVAGLLMVLAGSIGLARRGRSAGRLAVLCVGVVLMSPVLWIAAWELLELVPRNVAWDFSSHRSVSQLAPKEGSPVEGRDHDAEYYYQGNLRSSIRLPSGRQWSGSASSMYLRARSGQIVGIDWRGSHAGAAQTHREAGRMLGELGFAGHGLDRWYAEAGAGGRRAFSVEAGRDPMIRVEVRRAWGAQDASPEDALWHVNVYVSWEAR